MGRKPVVGVVGSNNKNNKIAIQNARALGNLIVREGWVVLSGGRDDGVMKAVNEGTKDDPKANGLTVGILPTATSNVAPDVDVVIVTDMNNARNNIIGLSSNVVVACGVDGPGTASEVALAIKNGKMVILLGAEEEAKAFFQSFNSGKVLIAKTPQEVIDIIKKNKLC